MMINPASRLGRLLHWIFEASLVIKGLLAFGEVLGGLGLLLTPNLTILHFVGWLTRHQLTQNPGEDMAVWAKHLADSFPIELQHFYAIYMLLHGSLKLMMVLMLAWRIVWAYPLAMAVLAGFVLYQLTEFHLHGGIVLLLLSGFDSIMIVLVWREFQILRRYTADEKSLADQQAKALKIAPAKASPHNPTL
jgi:uncharacterized membrane protein